jgi:hypothetical protein
MITKTIRSRFDHQIGDTVEGGKVVEKRVVIPPDPVERRRGVYEYVVETPPAPVKASSRSTSKAPASPKESAPERGSYTRATPEEMGSLIRRLPPR